MSISSGDVSADNLLSPGVCVVMRQAWMLVCGSVWWGEPDAGFTYHRTRMGLFVFMSLQYVGVAFCAQDAHHPAPTTLP